MKVSVIIRAKNEERWIATCLGAIFEQSFKDFEVILVDNKSTDRTVEKAGQYNVRILSIEDYRPGKALNLGIGAAKGEFLAFLSAHCIPKDKNWLSSLLRNFQDSSVAGVYGRQEPMAQTSDLDKRDLLIVFGLDRKVQLKDNFFHNANSMIRRSVWEKLPFDADVTNIEDRVWAKTAIEKGYKLIYEPDASVYHHHGIHQSLDPKRCRDIVRIMESMDGLSKKEETLIKKLKIVALIPVKGQDQYLNKRALAEYTIISARQSRFIDKVVVLTDNEETARAAEKMGAEVPFIRPTELSRPDVGIEKVLQYSLSELEASGNFFDLIVHMGVHAPFRPKNLIDKLIKLLFHNGFDSVFPGSPTYKSCWRQGENGFQRIDEGFIARTIKKPIHIGYPALACVTYPEFIRQGRLLGEKIGIYEILDVFSTIEITDQASLSLAEKIFPGWWKGQTKGGASK